MIRSRTPEELYDTRADPGCLDNLVDDPEHRTARNRFRRRMRDQLEVIDDHELANYESFLESAPQ